MIKNKKVLRTIIHLAIEIPLLLVVLTYGIGTYFIEFALVPNKGGGERDSGGATAQKNAEGYEELSKDLEVKIATARKFDSALCEAWLKEIANRTQEVSISSKDGLTLKGHEFLQAYPSDNWVIVVHGYQSSETSSQKIARHFYKRGFNALTISLRAHGESEGRYIGMGELDKDDLFLWTEHIVKKNKNAKIVYHGTSMGSATVLFASGLSLPENVRAIVSDCGYASVWDIFANELKNRFGLPTFPVLDMADIMGRIKAGYSIKNASVLKAVKNSRTPTLFIHTTSDDFVPVAMAYDLYKAHPGVKDLYIVRGANHTEAKYVNMDAYYTKIMNFLENKL